jgi:DNA-binding transcriptional LysR family regulator
VQEGIVRHVVLEVSHYVSVPLLVAESDLIATLPRPLAVKFAQLCDLEVLDLPFPTPPTEVKQFWHKRFDGHPRLQWLRHVVAEISQNRPSLGVG